MVEHLFKGKTAAKKNESSAAALFHGRVGEAGFKDNP
jgi:hypothetical protein